MEENKKFYQEVNLLRGFTIFTILYSHLFKILGGFNNLSTKPNTIVIKIIKFLFLFVDHNTSIFVFISGILFYLIFYKRGFDYKKFMIGKIRNVLCPYLFFCLVMIIIQFFLTPLFLNRFTESGIFIWTLKNLIEQTFLYWSLWYVPFVIILFSLAPIHIEFISFNKIWKIGVIAFFFCIAMIIGRPVDKNGYFLIQNVIYFTDIYLIGILIGQYYERILSFNKFVMLFFIFIFLCYGFFLVENNITDEYLFPIALEHPFKILEAIVLLRFFYSVINFKVLNKYNFPILSILAKYSFSLYFMHNIFIYIIDITIHWYKLIIINNRISTYILFSTVVSVFACFFIILLCSVIKRIIPNKSRFVIDS